MDFGHEVVKMAGALALIIIMLLAGLAWVRRTFGEVGGQSGEPILRVMGGLRLGAGKQILLVEVAGEVLVLGSTHRDLTLLTRIEEEHRIARLRSMTHPMLNTVEAWMSAWKSKTPHSRQHASSLGNVPKGRQSS